MAKKRLVLPKKGKKIGGVCQALANYFNQDVVLFRIVFILLALPGGLPGVVPYLIMWLLIPEEE